MQTCRSANNKQLSIAMVSTIVEHNNIIIAWIDLSFSHTVVAYITYRSMNVQIIIYYMFVHAIVYFAVLSPGALQQRKCVTF